MCGQPRASDDWLSSPSRLLAPVCVASPIGSKILGFRPSSRLVPGVCGPLGSKILAFGPLPGLSVCGQPLGSKILAFGRLRGCLCLASSAGLRFWLSAVFLACPPAAPVASNFGRGGLAAVPPLLWLWRPVCVRLRRRGGAWNEARGLERLLWPGGSLLGAGGAGGGLKRRRGGGGVRRSFCV